MNTLLNQSDERPGFWPRQFSNDVTMVTQSMNDLLRGDVHSAEFAIQKLRYVGWAADLDQVVWTYRGATDETRKATLAKAYKEITGEDISNRLNVMLD